MPSAFADMRFSFAATQTETCAMPMVSQLNLATVPDGLPNKPDTPT